MRMEESERDSWTTALLAPARHEAAARHCRVKRHTIPTSVHPTIAEPRLYAAAHRDF